MSRSITTINPATGQVLQTYQTMPREEVLAIVGKADAAFREWRRQPLGQRLACLRRAAGPPRGRRGGVPRPLPPPLPPPERGKPISEARAEVEKCAFLCDVYTERGRGWLQEECVVADGKEHRVLFEPLGVVLSIMPWNFPFWQALRFGVPTLLAGNASVLKHASNVPQCALAIERLFTESGTPPDLFRTLFTDHATIAELIALPLIRGVSLTGSTEAGRRIAEQAGRHLKKVVLELGGSDPFIVLDDADVEVAARHAVTGRIINAGQSCIAAKRFIVAESLAAAFTDCMVHAMSELIVGDPLDPATQVGPLVNQDGLDAVLDQLQRSVAMGAEVLVGGQRLRREGFFLAPAVLRGVRAGMPVLSEEVFGPVAPVIAVADEEEAIRVANDSEFGLGGSVWTRDLARGERVARRLETGTAFVNSIVKSDPRMPFGGVKHSGLGRELSQYGLREFVNIKGLNLYEHP